ncbi:GNAT family N-acetyltransferase [Phycicoccus sp. MAQZ13P-2]|uniref:GNAT family N-acetyltransferase n=1 Tax=Phycicoccus mangrovi TaxID=2840470 RepID=UPI001C008E56|nr:GNAT family N-acetyltransferase [Phycicoccus mangrovi]MBT9256295.1 GNAT family N-acetyltransferase [Phycicoccus mangrovi]MBT9273709.1 GNAT family N-acetyltransferase [Phycicoccus mangrovi]
MEPLETPPAEAALAVWLAARVAAGVPPTPERVLRVREKLSAEGAALLTATRGDSLAGMVLAEPWRAQLGRGAERELWGHISMVFVHPAHQRQGVGTELLGRLVSDYHWRNLSVWTRESNVGAQALYRRSGFMSTGDRSADASGNSIERLERSPLYPPT